MEKKNSDGVLAPIVAYSWVGSIILGVIAGIFNWETLGIICGIVFTICVAITFIPAIINLFK
jgi:hypothetical protein